jgi:protein-tyrosine phosphatase
MDQERFHVLVVCHANLCRSPMAEYLIRQEFLGRLSLDPEVFRVGSAGTHATPGRSLHPLAAETLGERGIDTASFRTRRLTADLVAGADLVLTATREQRAACVALVPVAVRRTFTLAQFGRYAAALSADRVEPGGAAEPGGPAEQVALIRAGLPVVPGDQDDLADPVHQPVAAFRRCLDMIEPIAGALTDLIAANRPDGVSATGSPPRR